MRTSPEFAANPVGEFFDPEMVFQNFAAGRGSKELQSAIHAGEFRPAVIPAIGLPV